MPAVTQIPEHYPTEFDTNWQHLVQQKMSKVRGMVLVDRVEGKEKSYNQMGPLEMERVTARAQETRITDMSLGKRWLRPYPHDLANIFDEWDDTFLGQIVLPASKGVQGHGFAYNRAVDRTIIEAGLNTAYVGEIGVTPVELPATQQVDVDYVETGSAVNSGLTIAKLRRAKFILDDNDTDDEDPRFLVHSAKQLTDMLRTVEVTSSDYNTIKALVDGKLDTFMGFKFIRVSSKILPVAADVRSCMAFCRSGITIADSGRTTHMDIRADKSHALQIRTVAALGGTRNEEEKVVEIFADES